MWQVRWRRNKGGWRDVNSKTGGAHTPAHKKKHNPLKNSRLGRLVVLWIFLLVSPALLAIFFPPLSLHKNFSQKPWDSAAACGTRRRGTHILSFRGDSKGWIKSRGYQTTKKHDWKKLARFFGVGLSFFIFFLIWSIFGAFDSFRMFQVWELSIVLKTPQ